MKRLLACLGLAVCLAWAAAWLLWPRPVPRATGPLPQGVYVWQRAWTPAVQEAIRDRTTRFQSLIVLAAEGSWRGGRLDVSRPPLKYDVLRALERPVGLALRLGAYAGPFAAADPPARAVADLAASLVTEARAQGLALAELQLDFDCAASKLEGYGLWVDGVRRAVAPVPVVVTALPSWLDRRAFRRLVAAADGYVLQVHSLERPRHPHDTFALCDPVAARRAVERAARLGRPFRVALPTYGYVVAFDAQGRFVGLSAEGPALSWPAGTTAREIRANPALMADLVAGWSRDRPEWFQGLIWYRLPVPGDRLNWAWVTLTNVMAGQVPRPSLRAEVRRPSAGLLEIALANDGTADQPGPVEVQLQWSHARLVAADGANGFDIVETGLGQLLFRSGQGASPLRPGQAETIGWARLEGEGKDAGAVQVEIITPAGGGFP